MTSSLRVRVRKRKLYLKSDRVNKQNNVRPHLKWVLVTDRESEREGSGDYQVIQNNSTEYEIKYKIFTQFKLSNEVDGFMQDCSNSIANALELLQSCTKSSTNS